MRTANERKRAAGAIATTAPAAIGEPLSPKKSPASPEGYHALSRPRNPRTLFVHAEGPNGRFYVTGQTGRALLAFVEAGEAGRTANEVSSWGYRLAAYVHDLRRLYGLEIEMLKEPHPGGWHGRYVLRSPVQVLAVQQVAGGRA